MASRDDRSNPTSHYREVGELARTASRWLVRKLLLHALDTQSCGRVLADQHKALCIAAHADNRLRIDRQLLQLGIVYIPVANAGGEQTRRIHNEGQNGDGLWGTLAK